MYFKNQVRLNRGSFIHPFMGFNFRITDLQAAVGVEQMKKLDFIVCRKSENENYYKQLLEQTPEVIFPADNKLGKRVPFRVNILVKDPDKLGEFLTQKDIGIRRFFYPLNHQPCFNATNSVRHPCPQADQIFKKGLSLPSGVGLSKAQIKFVCDAIINYFKK